MANARKFVLSNLLCFTANKWHSIASKPLKSLLVDYYSNEDIETAKELFFIEMDTLKIGDSIKLPRRRRESTGVNNIDDILTLFSILDERGLLEEIASFVSSSPDAMPASR